MFSLNLLTKILVHMITVKGLEPDTQLSVMLCDPGFLVGGKAEP